MKLNLNLIKNNIHRKVDNLFGRVKVGNLSIAIVGDYSYSIYQSIDFESYTIEDKVARPLYGVSDELDDLIYIILHETNFN